MKGKILIAGAAALAGTTLVAVPTVSNVTLSQPTASKIEIGYDLSENAVVTLDIRTNDVSIGSAKIIHLAGDVNQTIAAGTGKKIVWSAFKDWPDGDAVSARAVVTAWSLDAPPPYCAISLESPGVIYFYPDVEALPGGVSDRRYKKEYLLLRKIPAAGVTWRMGTPYAGDTCTISNEFPHSVTFTKDYYIGVYEFTRAQYKSYRTDWACNENMSTWNETNICWPLASQNQEMIATSLLQALNDRCQHRMTVRLPTDAEWEYAARAGTGATYIDGSDVYSKSSPYYANKESTLFAAQKAEVGTTTLPNAWGLYDMCGNVMELVSDVYRLSITEAETDPTGPDPTTFEGTKRTIWRGGSYNELNDDSSLPFVPMVRLAHRRNMPWDSWYGGDMGHRYAAPAVVAMPVAK